MSHVVTVPELLDGHTVLDIECLDRVYLGGYVPTLQVGGQVFTFLHDHRGMPVASPAVFGQISGQFRQAVDRFAQMNDIPVVKFKKGIRKLDVMQRYLRAAARADRPGVAAIGRAEEFQLVWDARQRDSDPSRPPQFFLRQGRAAGDLLLLLCLRRAAGAFCFNCDIATPMLRCGADVFAVDLFADVLVRADGTTFAVTGVDELRQAAGDGLVSQREAAHAVAELGRPAALLTAGRLPEWLAAACPSGSAAAPPAAAVKRVPVPRQLSPRSRATW